MRYFVTWYPFEVIVQVTSNFLLCSLTSDIVTSSLRCGMFYHRITAALVCYDLTAASCHMPAHSADDVVMMIDNSVFPISYSTHQVQSHIHGNNSQYIYTEQYPPQGNR